MSAFVRRVKGERACTRGVNTGSRNAKIGLYSPCPPGLKNRDKQLDIPGIIGRWLCRLGFHDFEVLEAILGFSDAGGVEKVKCRRCLSIYTREV